MSTEPEPNTGPNDQSSPDTDEPTTTKPVKGLRADKPAQALHSQWAPEDANRTARQREADRTRWRDV